MSLASKLPPLGVHIHIVGCLITALYYNNLGYVLAQVVSLVFRKQNAQSKLLEYTMSILLSHLLTKYYTLHLCQNIAYIIVIETGDESTHYVYRYHKFDSKKIFLTSPWDHLKCHFIA